MRSYYNIKDETWKDCLSKKIDISKPFLSLNCDYGKFVSQYLKYPTLDEFILYSFRRYILNSKFYNTLPSYISLICQSVLDDFSPVIKDINPELFKQIFNDSAPIQTRIKLENNEN